MLNRNHDGFSLVELMVVIAIIGLIAAIAMPSYKNYQIRVRMTAAINRVDTLKKEFEKQYAITGNVQTAGSKIPSLVDNVVNAAWNGSAIRVYISGTLNTDIGGGSKQLLLTPVIDSNSQSIGWKCSAQFNYPIACIYLPNNCQGPYCY